MPANNQKKLFQEANIYRLFYLSTCVGVLYCAWGSYESLLLLFFKGIGEESQGFLVLVALYVFQGLFYIVAGSSMQSNIPQKQRHIYMGLCSAGYVFFLVAAMNLAYCSETFPKFNEDGDRIIYNEVAFHCNYEFRTILLVVASMIGGISNGLMSIITGIQVIEYSRPWCRARFNSIFNSFFIASWAVGLALTSYLLPALNDSVYNYFKWLTIVTSVATFLFFFVQPPIPPKIDQRDKEMKDYQVIDKASIIIDEIYEQDEPKLENLVKQVSSSYDEEQAIMKYIRQSDKAIELSGKKITTNQYIIKMKEVWQYLTKDWLLPALIAAYLCDGMIVVWFRNCSLWIVQVIQQKEEQANTIQGIDLVINIDITAKCTELFFLNFWGTFFDRARKKSKKAIFLITHLTVCLFLGLTILGQQLLNYEIFYSVAVFYGISTQGFKATLGPARNEQYAPDYRKILYSLITYKFIVNITQGIGFLSGSYLNDNVSENISFIPLYFLIIIIPVLFISFLNMQFRIRYKG